MTITNGYATLNEAKQRLQKKVVYTAATLSFTNSTSKIADTAYGLKRFLTGDILTISGSASNDGIYTVTTGNVANEIVTTESLTDEAVGESVTIQHTTSTSRAIDPSDDVRIEQVVEAASRWIDTKTGRRFYGETETRSFVVGEDTDGAYLYFDKPLLSITTLTNGDGNTVAATEYTTEPRNETPLTAIRLLDKSSVVWQYADDQYEDAITVLGSWGYVSSTPPDIKDACLLLVSRLWARKDAVFGVSGQTTIGELTSQFPKDPDVFDLISSYKKRFDDWDFG